MKLPLAGGLSEQAREARSSWPVNLGSPMGQVAWAATHLQKAATSHFRRAAKPWVSKALTSVCSHAAINYPQRGLADKDRPCVDYVHIADDVTPIEKTMEALLELKG